MPHHGPQNLFILKQIIDSYEKKSSLSEVEIAGLTFLKAVIKKIYDEVETLSYVDKNSQVTFPSVATYALQYAADSGQSDGVIKYLTKLSKDQFSVQENKWDKAALLQRMHDYEQGDTIEIRIAAFKNIMTDIYKCIGTNVDQIPYFLEEEQKKAVTRGETSYAEFLAEASRCFLGLKNRIALLVNGEKSILKESMLFLPIFYRMANAFNGTLRPANQLLDPLAGVERASMSDFSLGFGQCVGITREWLERGKHSGKWLPTLLVGGLYSLEAQMHSPGFFSIMTEPTALNFNKATFKDISALVSKIKVGESQIFIVEGKDASHVIGLRKTEDPTSKVVRDELFDSSFGSFYFTSHSDLEKFFAFYLNKCYRTELFLGWPKQISIPEKNTAPFKRDSEPPVVKSLPTDEFKFTGIMMNMADSVTTAIQNANDATILRRVFVDSLRLMVNQMSDVAALAELREELQKNETCKFLKVMPTSWFWESKKPELVSQCLKLVDNRIKTIEAEKEEQKNSPGHGI